MAKGWKNKRSGTSMPDYKMNMWPCARHPESGASPSSGLCKACVRSYSRKRRDRNINAGLDRFNVTRCNARRRGIAWTLTLEQFQGITSQPCVYATHQQDGIRVGIDRRDNAHGYTMENSVPCCQRHNRIKSDAFTFEEMRRLVRRCVGARTCGNAPLRIRERRSDE